MKPRYAQESHTHSGLVGGAGEGWSGVVQAAHSTAAGSVMSIGHSVSAAGSTTSVDTALSLTGTAFQKYPRTVRKQSGYYGGVHGSTAQRWLNTWRGFHCRWIFGTVGTYDSSNALFAGLLAAVPAATVTTFASWPSAYALGVWKEAGANTIDWVWRTDASTTGSASTGLSWSSGATYSLSLDCEPVAAGGVTATLADSNGGSASYTFTSFPDANVNAAAILTHGCLITAGSGTTQLGFHTFDSVEPW